MSSIFSRYGVTFFFQKTKFEIKFKSKRILLLVWQEKQLIIKGLWYTSTALTTHNQ